MAPDRSRWRVLTALSFSLFMIMLDNTVVNVALASIQRDLGLGLAALEWTVNAYALTFAALLLMGGKLADYFGRKRIFIAGLVVFTVSSLLCGLAANGAMLIAARTVQGFGAALMLPASLSIIAATFGPRERGTAIGIWAGVSLTALSLGPLAGGALSQLASWHWIFFVNVPIGVAGIAVAWAVVPESRDGSLQRRIDVPGLVTSAAGLFLLIGALIEANRYGWGSTIVLAAFAGGLVCLIAFVALEHRRPLPMLDLSLFRNTSFTGANLVALLSVLALFGVFFYMSLFLQTVLGYRPIETGAAFLPMTLILAATTPLAGRLSDRFGPRWPMTAGMSVVAIALAWSSALDATAGVSDVLPPLILAGVGFALTMTPMTAAVLASAPDEKAGVASGVVNAFRQVGGSLGVALMGAILAASLGAAGPGEDGYEDLFLSGFRDALLLAAAIAVVGAVVAWGLVREPRGA